MNEVKEFPDRILLIKDCNGNLNDYWALGNLTLDEDAEYIRKDVVDKMLKIAKEHAHLKGSEAIEDLKCFEKIKNYQVEGWYSNSKDEEFIYGISFDEPVKLPVEFYVKKK